MHDRELLSQLSYFEATVRNRVGVIYHGGTTIRPDTVPEQALIKTFVLLKKAYICDYQSAFMIM